MPPVERPAAVLVSVQLPDVDDVQHAADLAELGRLVHTLGLDVVATVTQRRRSLAPAVVVGDGKLLELGKLTGGSGVVPAYAKAKLSKVRAKQKAAADEAAGEAADEGTDDGEPGDDDEVDGDEPASADGPGPAPARKATVVVVDHEITPSQARNLEKATDAQVLDRTGVIVEIFHRHARGREAKLQVEIARLHYVAPRLRETGGGGDRVRGGVGGKGAGESAMELDRRKIRDRIAELREELTRVVAEQETRAKARKEQLRVALVGYTNAGKSSLMRALTGSDVLVADKLFATLDTTVRILHPVTHPHILVSDTVGFIKKLPHDLVASFRSTLAEALEATLLLYVVDASDPTHAAQLAVTREVLAEIGADAVPSLLVLNKVDRLDAVGRAALRAQHPAALQLSAKDPADVARLRQALIDHFDRTMMEDAELVVPYGRQALVSEIHESARVLEETYDDRGALLRVRAVPATLARIRTALAK
ncbi:MAG: GTPase HflX [Polyangiales bacterium]